MFESDYLGNEQARLAKHKSGYIFPIIYKVIMTDDGQNYICNFKQDNSYKNCAFIICFKDGLICDISSSVLTYFNYDALTVKNNKINIHDIVEIYPQYLSPAQYIFLTYLFLPLYSSINQTKINKQTFTAGGGSIYWCLSGSTRRSLRPYKIRNISERPGKHSPTKIRSLIVSLSLLSLSSSSLKTTQKT